MKKWLLAWIVFTGYLIANMTVMPTAEQPHLVATMLLGFFYFLIFGMRGVYFALTAVSAIVVLALIVHQFHHPHYDFDHYSSVFLRFVLDIVTIFGGGGVAYWMKRLKRSA
ncbi:MAG: hypothetical protein WCC10_12265 [Tumebacillaceae bacterium]